MGWNEVFYFHTPPVSRDIFETSIIIYFEHFHTAMVLAFLSNSESIVPYDFCKFKLANLITTQFWGFKEKVNQSYDSIFCKFKLPS